MSGCWRRVEIQGVSKCLVSFKLEIHTPCLLTDFCQQEIKLDTIVRPVSAFKNGPNLILALRPTNAARTCEARWVSSVMLRTVRDDTGASWKLIST